VTQTQQWVNDTCERIVAGGVVWLHKDLYKDLRERLPCGVACRLIYTALDRTCLKPVLAGVPMPWGPFGERLRAFAALKRLERYADVKKWGEY
jgi:hypothetical protein